MSGPSIVEHLAGECFPLIEPVLLSVRKRSQNDGARYRVVCSGIQETGPSLARGGITLEPAGLPLDEVLLGIGFHLFNPSPDQEDHTAFGLTVGWSRAWSDAGQAGFQIQEFAAMIETRDVHEARRWLSEVLPRFEAAAHQAIRRGYPPSRLGHWIQRMTRGLPSPGINSHQEGNISRYPHLKTFARTHDQIAALKSDAPAQEMKKVSYPAKKGRTRR